MSTIKCFWKVDKLFFHVSAAEFNIYYLLIKFEPTEGFNLKGSYLNYNIVIFLTNVDNSNIIMIFYEFFHALILFLSSDDVELV